MDSLTPNSSNEAVKKAISDSIAQCMREGGREQKQCVAIAFSTARKQTGSGSGGRQGRRKIRAGLEK